MRGAGARSQHTKRKTRGDSGAAQESGGGLRVGECRHTAMVSNQIPVCQFPTTLVLAAAGWLRLTHTLSQRVARFLERRGLLERDVENSYLVYEQQKEAECQDQWLLAHGQQGVYSSYTPLRLPMRRPAHWKKLP